MSTDQMGDGAAGEPDTGRGLDGPALDGVTLDAEFVLAAAVSEPSARERRKAAQAARRAQRRREVRARLPRPPAIPERLRPSRRTVVGLALVAALAGGVVWASSRGNAGGARNANADSAREIAAALGEMRAAATSEARAVSPFEGTPAAALADGEAALERAAAEAVAATSATSIEEFTAEEVAIAALHTRRLLAAAHLDHKVVIDGDPEPVLRLLAPHSATRLRTALATPTPDLSASAFLTRFPDGTALAGPVVKSTAAMTISRDRPGVLRVSAEAAFVYPVRPATGGTTTLVIVRHEGAWDYERTAGGMSPAEVAGGAGTWSSGQCLENDLGFVWPPFLTAPSYERRATAPAHNAWDFEGPLTPSGGCSA